MDYKNYLKSTHWQSVRKLKLYEANYMCEKCGSKRDLNVHHLRYDTLYCEINEDLMVVCQDCHTNIMHAENETQKKVGEIMATLVRAKNVRD